jgi:hypothetical protein
MAKHRANGHRWPGMLQSSKDRAKPVRIGFAGEFWFPDGRSLPSWAAAAIKVENLCSRQSAGLGHEAGP